MSVVGALQCLSLSLILASHHISNIVVPINKNITIWSLFTLELDSITCPSITLGTVGVDYYTTSGLSVYAMEDTTLSGCRLNGRAASAFGSNDTAVALSVDLGVAKGSHFSIKTEIGDPLQPCFITNASVDADEFNITVSNLSIDVADKSIPISDKTIMAWITKELNVVMNHVSRELLEGVAASVWSTRPIPLSPFPEYVHGCQKVSEWPLARLIRTIAHNLPTVEGIRLAASYPADTALRLNASLPPLFLSDKNNNTNNNNDNNNNNNNDFNKKIIEEFGIYSLSVPQGVVLSVDVGFKMLVCRATPFECTALHGIELLNLRAYGGENYHLFNSMIAPLVTSTLTTLLMNNTTDTPFDVTLSTDRSIADPPKWVIILTGPLLAICAVAAVAFSAHRHTVTPVLDAFGNSITVTRVIVEDCFIVSVCFGCIYLFIWSNTTTAATVVIGDEIEVYSFSLVNTVEDLWNAGLYPLSFFVCLFSGVYPYIKLITIVVYSVLLQRPQSRILRIVDNLGKFSLLDTFVMTILKTGLELQGIAAVNSQPSFYIFMTATVLSIGIGNYATHGWRRETSVRRKSDFEGEMTASLITYQQSSYSNRSESNINNINNNNNKVTTPNTALTTPTSQGAHCVYITTKKPDSITAEIDASGNIIHNENNNNSSNTDSASKKKKKKTNTTTSSGSSSSSKRQKRSNTDENNNNNNDSHINNNNTKCATPSNYSNPDGTTPGTPTTPIDVGILSTPTGSAINHTHNTTNNNNNNNNSSNNNNINNNNNDAGYGANGVRTAADITTDSPTKTIAPPSGCECSTLLVKNSNSNNSNNNSNDNINSNVNKNSNSSKRFVPVVLLKEGDNNKNNNHNTAHHIVAVVDGLHNINANNSPTTDTNDDTNAETPITLTSSSDEDSRRIYTTRKKWYQVWEWQLAVPFSIIVFICTLMPCLYDTLQYNVSGMAVLVMGTRRVFSMWSLFTACETYLVMVGIFTTLIAPVLYILTYPHGRFLSAWCATDAFLLACVAGLVQLKQFIAFVLGPGMEPVYSASCVMLWPLIPLLISMLVQWLFIAKHSLNVRGLQFPCLRSLHQWYTLRSSTV